MDLHAVLMTIVAFSAVVAVFSYAVNLLLKPVEARLSRLEKDIESLKTGQGKLEGRLAKLEAGQVKLEGLLKELLAKQSASS